MTRLEKINGFLSDPVFMAKAKPEVIEKFKKEAAYLDGVVFDTIVLPVVEWLKSTKVKVNFDPENKFVHLKFRSDIKNHVIHEIHFS